MTRVPMRAAGAVYDEATISETKLEVRPMMMMSPTNCMARMTVNVRPKAPRAGGAAIFLMEVGVLSYN